MSDKGAVPERQLPHDLTVDADSDMMSEIRRIAAEARRGRSAQPAEESDVPAHSTVTPRRAPIVLHPHAGEGPFPEIGGIEPDMDDGLVDIGIDGPTETAHSAHPTIPYPGSLSSQGLAGAQAERLPVDAHQTLPRDTVLPNRDSLIKPGVLQPLAVEPVPLPDSEWSKPQNPADGATSSSTERWTPPVRLPGAAVASVTEPPSPWRSPRTWLVVAGVLVIVLLVILGSIAMVGGADDGAPVEPTSGVGVDE